MPSKKLWDNVLVWLKPQYLGDAVMALPLLDELIEASGTVIVRANKVVLSLLADRRVEHLEAVKFTGLNALNQASRQLRSHNLDAAFLVDRNFRSAATVWLSRTPVRVGHATEGRSFLLTHTKPYDSLKSEVACGLDLLSGFVTPSQSRTPKLSLVGSDCLPEGAKKGLRVGFQPGARYASKQFPVASLAEVARMLQEPCLILGGKDEIDAGLVFESAMKGIPVHNWIGKTTLRESMALLSTLDVFVGSDTGLMHVAAALGVPTVTIFGPNPASKWGHNYSPHQVIVAPELDPAKLSCAVVYDAIETALQRV